MYAQGLHIPHPHLPNPVDWMKSVVGSWISSVDPLTHLAGLLSSSYNWMMGFYETLLIQLPGSQQQKWVIDLLNSALGDAQFLSVGTSLLLAGIAIFKWGKLHAAIWSWLVTVVLLLAGDGWYWACYWGMGLSRELSKSAEIYHPASNAHHYPLLYFDPITSILGAFFGYGILLFWGYALLCLLLSYMVADVLIMAFGIIGFALRFWGKMTEKLSDLLISIGIVTMVLGTPAAILCLNVGRLMGDWLGASPVGQASGAGPLMGFIGVSSGFFWAFVWQVILVVGTSIAVSKVSGHVNAFSQIFGKVQTSPQRHEVDVRRFNEEHANSMRPIVTEGIIAGSAAKVIRYIKEEGKHQAIAAGATAVAAYASGGTSLAAQAVTTAASRTAVRHSAPPPPVRKEATDDH